MINTITKKAVKIYIAIYMFFVGFSVFAQETGLVPCTGDEGNECGYAELIELVKNVIDFIFVLIIPIAAIGFSYAGFILLFSGGSPEKRKKAKDVFTKMFIGLIVILTAWLIVATILKALGVDDAYILIDL